jgi:hypothetical protein
MVGCRRAREEAGVTGAGVVFDRDAVTRDLIEGLA